MSTTSAGHPVLVKTRPSSQFGQFRFPQFVNAQTTLTNATSATTTTDAYPIATSLSTKASETEPMAQVNRPLSGQNSLERAPSVVPSRAMPPDHGPTNSSPHTGLLELVELSSNPSIEGVLGPNKDGRVRNPVPSKLKGKTDNKQGNFGVMHMGMSPGKKTEAQARDNAAERDAAARRTSENTAFRAKAAQQEKYVPPKKRGAEAALNDPASRGSPFAVSKNDDRSRARPLAPDETKFEQARLLTLLRSINPVTVVDQICKAIAYFGGIPGAPPPEDGIFPESANTRETGALFIGWVAEIFPDLSSRSPEVSNKVAAHGAAGKKKKRPSVLGKKDDGSEIEPPNSRNGYGYGPAISAPAWGLPPSLALVNTPIPAPAPAPIVAEGGQTSGPGFEQIKPTDQTPDMGSKPQQEDAGDNASNKRRRGRPKGSRNKSGKGDAHQGGENPEPLSNNAIVEQQPHQATEMVSGAMNSRGTSAFGGASHQPNMHKPTQAYQYPAQSWNSSQKGGPGQNMVPPADDQLSPEERAVLEAFRQHSVDASNTSAPAPTLPVKVDAEKAFPNDKKRKRAPAKPKPNPPPADATPTANPVGEYAPGTQNTSIPPASNPPSVSHSSGSAQWSPAAATAPTVPPAKKPRVRKPKVSAPTEAQPRSQTASGVSNATPPVQASTIPEPQISVPQQQSQPVSRPPAEGLEAHYERFANLQQTNLQQQNGRSHTPTQQQPRQQSKPASVTPQQSTPQLQHQMQQQKSQQGNQQSLQKDDQKLVQAASSSRPTSTTTYYNNQRSQSTPFNQQFPSHQSSQLYTAHQGSPQLSNNSTNAATTNFNRAYNAHSLTQVSPQFSQSETSYRTASPHTITQPSPSFSQTESSFRPNTHNITQPTAAYSQPENPYRAPTSNALTQPSTSYSASRTHTQPQASHQSHYNHFPDSSFIDLPTLESLGHTGNSASSTGVGMSVGPYGQGLGVGQGTSRSTGASSSLYGTSSGLTNAFDTSSNELLRGVSRSASNTNPTYGATSSGLGAFDASGNTEHELRERLLRGLGRR